MALADFLKELDELAEQATAAIRAAADADALEAARIEFLGAKSGRMKDVQKGLGRVDKADKPAAGKRFNEVKEALAAELELRQSALVQVVHGGASPDFDPTVPGRRPVLGHLHPVTQTIEELVDIMGRLGFTVAEGPEVEDLWHNFDALNISLEHPARDPLDNFYLATGREQKRCQEPYFGDCPRSLESVPQEITEIRFLTPLLWMLRSQTSTVQIRVMEKTKPPVRIISLGRVYRPDTADATHYPMFHQIEGLLVDRHVTMADLKSILRLFAKSFFEDDVHVRFRPSFFPFTEPSVEVDMSWAGNWIEFGGAGMVDPNVLRAVGYDPEEYSGLAFGLGIERICMRRHGITDIRELYKNDVRFLHQF
ncbi:MAG TPA: phenylalanine--tRNA ligase subunit alpha [Thermoguttaceae bacterium]|nr:phenylalanine--tRNA ligase subunit alpha [Thermoguttaceae bacterium]